MRTYKIKMKPLSGEDVDITAAYSDESRELAQVGALEYFADNNIALHLDDSELRKQGSLPYKAMVRVLIRLHGDDYATKFIPEEGDSDA